jgi:hypothetical protein
MKILVTATSFKKDSKSPAMDKLRSFADSLVSLHAFDVTKEE